jgi:hypothetical protein
MQPSLTLDALDAFDALDAILNVNSICYSTKKVCTIILGFNSAVYEDKGIHLILDSWQLFILRRDRQLQGLEVSVLRGIHIILFPISANIFGEGQNHVLFLHIS